MRLACSIFASLLVAASASSQTTTWTAATNPHVVKGIYTVGANETLILEAGVIVQIQANSTLQIDGHLVGNGTAAKRITITGATNYDSVLDVAGTSSLQFTDVKAKTVPDTGGTLLFADCSFTGNGNVFNGQILQMEGTHAPYLQFDRCKFTGDGTNFSASLYVSYCTVVVRDTTFTNGSYCDVYPAYLYLNNVSSDHSVTAGLALGSDSDLFLDNISATNATRAGLLLAGDTRNGTNVLIGPNVTLQGNEYPVHLTIAGLYPTSNIPATGNTKNQIHVSQVAGAGGFWPRFAIPYYNDASPLTIGNRNLHIFPGVTVKMAIAAYFNDVAFGDGVRAYGTKDLPIRFERADAAQSWYDLHSDRTEGGRLRFCIVDGSSDGVNGGAWRLENCVFQNNGIGTSGDALVSGSQYLRNGLGHDSGGGSLSDINNPNSFEGNSVGLYYSPDARNCWWNSPTGPRAPGNPGGTGDSIEHQLTVYKPFLTTRPSYADTPPEVVLMRPAFQQDPGSKVTLRWKSTDDVGIVSHKILFSAVGNWPGSFQTVATLPGGQQSYEWTVPAIGFQTSGSNAYVKVVAVDTTGKESFDEAEIVIPTNDIAGDVQFDVTAGQTFEPGEILASVFTGTGIDRYMTRVEFYIEDVRADLRKMFSRGANGGGIPFISTDSARFVVSYGDTSNHRKYWYSPLFKVRPNTRLGDAPPTIAISSPAAGQSFPPGAPIPLVWSASDDEGLRAFDIVASYDGGRTWNPIVRDLPGAVRSYPWEMAPGTGYTDVRVMVIAKDLRFQSTSDVRSFKTNGGATTPAVTSLSLSPTKIATGESSTGTITISAAAPANGTLVTLSHNGQTFLDVPANITIPPGATMGTFQITTTNVGVTGTFQITASSAGVTKSALLDVTLKVMGVDLPASIEGGSSAPGDVELSGPAPVGGAVVNLSSSDAGVSVPASVTVPEGGTTAAFTAVAQSVTTQKSITVSGEHAGTVKQISVTVTPQAPRVMSLAKSNGKMRIGFSSINGAHYALQRATKLVAPDWATLSGTTVTGTGGTMTVEDPAAANLSSAFYRVILVP